MFDRFEDPQEFEIVGVVVLFCGGEGSGVVRDRVSFSRCHPFCSSVLGQDCPYSVLGCVGLEIEGFVEVGLLEDRFADHLVSGHLKHALLFVSPVPWHRLFGEVEQSLGDLRVPLDEVVVVPGKPKKLAYFADVPWLDPLFDLIDL